MISIDTILSLFNEKGTLLQWLKKVEEALNGATLSSVTVLPQTATTVQLQFNFEDDTTVTSSTLTLPQGAPGKDGQNGTDGAPGRGITNITSGAPLVDPLYPNYTATPITASYTDGSAPSYFKVYAKDGAQGAPGKDGQNGTDGAPGRGIVTMASGQPEEDPLQPGYTATPVTALYSDGTSPSSFKVYAKNGQDGTGGGSDLEENNIVKNISEVTFRNMPLPTPQILLRLTLDKYDNSQVIIGSNNLYDILATYFSPKLYRHTIRIGTLSFLAEQSVIDDVNICLYTTNHNKIETLESFLQNITTGVQLNVTGALTLMPNVYRQIIGLTFYSVTVQEQNPLTIIYWDTTGVNTLSNILFTEDEFNSDISDNVEEV